MALTPDSTTASDEVEVAAGTPDPCVVLATHYNDSLFMLGETTDALRPVEEAQVQDCINVLRVFERDNGVRFMALPAEALTRLQNLWEYQDDQVLFQQAVAVLRDLFRGQDGHLLALDTVIGCENL